jgi:hypothetical protein
MLILYSTWGCHLCEDAERLLVEAVATFRVVDIVDDPQAYELYRTSIPVVVSADAAADVAANVTTAQRLFWPFDQHRLAAFINDLSMAGEGN